MAEPIHNAERGAEARASAGAEARPEAQAGVEAQPEAQVGVEARPEAQAGVDARSEAQAEAEARPDAQAGVRPDAEALAAAAGRAGRRGPPPVHLWNPPFCGDLDMRIARDGTWHYLGTPIGRPALARLFASILKREGDAYFLVTPVEKVGIRVDDAPFVAVDFMAEGAGEDQRLTFETNMGDVAAAGPENPIRMTRDPGTGEPAPYVHIRRGLEALIDRKSFYRLAELGAERDGQFGVWSGGVFFPFIPAEELAV